MVYYEEIREMLKATLKSDFRNMQKADVEACVNQLFLTYKKMNGNEKEISLESLEKILRKEELIISYAYGAYITNQIARICKDSKVQINWKNIQELKKLKNAERKRELRKYAFANKDMFIKQIIEQSKNNTKYEMGWEVDEKGMHTLNINLTNYRQYSFKERRKRGFPEDVIISVHVVDPRLTQPLIELKKYPQRGSKPAEIFKERKFEGR